MGLLCHTDSTEITEIPHQVRNAFENTNDDEYSRIIPAVGVAWTRLR